MDDSEFKVGGKTFPPRFEGLLSQCWLHCLVGVSSTAPLLGLVACLIQETVDLEEQWTSPWSESSTPSGGGLWLTEGWKFPTQKAEERGGHSSEALPHVLIVA